MGDIDELKRACNGDDNCIECAPEVEVSMPGTIAKLKAEVERLQTRIRCQRSTNDEQQRIMGEDEQERRIEREREYRRQAEAEVTQLKRDLAAAEELAMNESMKHSREHLRAERAEAELARIRPVYDAAFVAVAFVAERARNVALIHEEADDWGRIAERCDGSIKSIECRVRESVLRNTADMIEKESAMTDTNETDARRDIYALVEQSDIYDLGKTRIMEGVEAWHEQIDELQAEVERLTRERDEARAEVRLVEERTPRFLLSDAKERGREWAKRAVAAEAELARIRPVYDAAFVAVDQSRDRNVQQRPTRFPDLYRTVDAARAQEAQDE